MPTFDLVTQPWIPCLLPNGRLVERSLHDVLTAPQSVREIVDPSPLVTVALHRLLLAILHRALDGPRDEDEWAEWWEDGCWPLDPVRQYLARWQHRFDLFDPDRPFHQHPGVDHQYRAESARLATELASSFNAPLLFDHSDPAQVALTPAAAARYLVAYQAFSTGGLLSGRTPAERASKAAPLCAVAVCLGKGEDLARTLLLHLVSRPFWGSSYQPPTGHPTHDLPAWERPDLPGDQPRWPTGYLDYLTWQARRVLLIPDDRNGQVVVSQAVIMRGESFPDGFEQRQLETMVPFRKDSKRGWLALTFREDRALWRDSLALMQTISTSAVDQQRPRIVDWWAFLYRLGVLPGRVLPLDVAGFVPDQAKPLFWRYERFPLPLSLLDDQLMLLWIEQLLKMAEEAARLLVEDLRRLATYLGIGDKQRGSFVAGLGSERVFWATLEPTFYTLLHRLSRGEPPPTVCADWQTVVQRSAQRAFEQAALALLRAGRPILTIAEAESRLQARLAMITCGAAATESPANEEGAG
ncbi:type I-E CRISPR-associated protein Cse1/CasA [Thermomicrobium sp.]